MSVRVAPPLTSLRGRRLLFARLAWVAVAITVSMWLRPETAPNDERAG